MWIETSSGRASLSNNICEYFWKIYLLSSVLCLVCASFLCIFMFFYAVKSVIFLIFIIGRWFSIIEEACNVFNNQKGLLYITHFNHTLLSHIFVPVFLFVWLLLFFLHNFDPLCHVRYLIDSVYVVLIFNLYKKLIRQ